MTNRLKGFFSLLFVSLVYWVLAFLLFITIRYHGLEQELKIFTDEYLGLPVLAFYHYAILLGLIVAVFYAVIEFLFDNFLSKRLILGISIGIKSLVYFALIIIVLSSLTFLIEEQIDIDLQNERGWWRTNPFFWNTVMYFVVASITFSLIRIANDKFGRGVFFNMLLGKYKQPKEEERVLMFVDLKDSTTIAEVLGHELYSQFIQDCFKDLNSVLKRYDAEVYQYVGDEAVITWMPPKAFKKNNCISLFFAFQQKLKKKANYYQTKYSYQPQFKAGIHYGKLMIAEVGTVKKELAFHGDVINTASRIQKLCNSFDKPLLVSESVLNRLSISDTHYSLLFEDAALKGKTKRLKIYAINITQ